MKKITFIFAAVLVALAGRAALPQPDLIAQIHFAGGDRVSADQNYSAFTNEFATAEFQALRKQTADKLAPWLAGWLQVNQGATVADGAVKLRPLLDDLQAAEWFLDARAVAGGKPDVAIAIKLAPARAQAWEAALKPYFSAATFKQSGGWLIFDSGTGTVKAGDFLAQKISAPPAGWLNVDVNWPRLAQWHPELKELGLPETKFDVGTADAGLNIAGKFFFPEAISSKLDAWQFPTNTVHQQLTSFTAARGFAGWLNGQSWAQSFRISPAANELFIWAVAGSPFRTFAAVPVKDAAGALPQLNAGLGPVVAERNAHGGFVAPFKLGLADNQLSLTGTPVVAPYIKPVDEPSGQFLLVGGYPNTPKTSPLPPELFQRLAVPNLVYYHWEITAERFQGMLAMSQLMLVLTHHKQLDGTGTAYKWLARTCPALGNTVTEVTQAAPDQMTFTRKGPGGLTAFEFLALANWLEAPDFPHCDLSAPAMSDRLKKLREKSTNVPAASAPGH